MADDSRRDRFWTRWLARLGIACGIAFVWCGFVWFHLSAPNGSFAIRWQAFWAWLFCMRNGEGIILLLAGMFWFTVAFYLRLLASARNPDSTRTIALLFLVSSLLAAALIFLLALAAILTG